MRFRYRKESFRVTHRTPCTEHEWQAGVKDGRSLRGVRKESEYTNGDEFRRAFRPLPDGSLEELSGDDIASMDWNERGQLYHWLEDGVIEEVFKSSAIFCGALDANAFSGEEAVVSWTEVPLPEIQREKQRLLGLMPEEAKTYHKLNQLQNEWAKLLNDEKALVFGPRGHPYPRERVDYYLAVYRRANGSPYGTWSEAKDVPDHGIRIRFGRLARESGIAAGCPLDCDARDFWLHWVYIRLLSPAAMRRRARDLLRKTFMRYSHHSSIVSF